MSACQALDGGSIPLTCSKNIKKYVDIMYRNKIKGLKIDLTSLRNAIINVNKKRGDYVSNKEEIEQMKKLGIKDDV